jgi:hypothetical protein
MGHPSRGWPGWVCLDACVLIQWAKEVLRSCGHGVSKRYLVKERHIFQGITDYPLSVFAGWTNGAIFLNLFSEGNPCMGRMGVKGYLVKWMGILRYGFPALEVN